MTSSTSIDISFVKKEVVSGWGMGVGEDDGLLSGGLRLLHDMCLLNPISFAKSEVVSCVGPQVASQPP
jgi:hypothetical protein